MKKLCLALSVVLLMLHLPRVCFGDTVIPISGGASLFRERGSGDHLYISGPGFSFDQMGFSSSPVTYCPLGTPCILQLSAEVYGGVTWSHAGVTSYSDALADFTMYPIPFTIPDPCVSSLDRQWCYADLEMGWGLVVPAAVPASILGTIQLLNANGGYAGLDMSFIGTGTFRLNEPFDVADAYLGAWGAGMDFQGTAFLPTPEPGTFALLCTGLAGLAAALRRRMHRKLPNCV